MSQGNVYKPRYKVAFQAKSKIWPYKNSRLRRFFNIRGRKLVRRGFFKRHVVVFNNMKWTVARRYVRPAMRRRKAIRRRFRDAFYTKQQLRLFHGKFKEQAFRVFFRRYLAQTVNRNRSFFSALERRIDIFFFRMRLLPTIFACHQYIHHHGILINRKFEYSPNALLSAGDMVSIRRKHWKSIFWYVHDRLYYRVYGQEIRVKRRFTLLKKKTWWIRRRIRRSRWMFLLNKKRLYLTILVFRKRKNFLFFFNIFLHILSNFLEKKTQIAGTFSSYEVKQFNNYIKETLSSLNTMYISYKKLFYRIGKSSKLVKNRLKSVFFPYRFFMRKRYLKLMYLLGSIFTIYLQVYSLETQLKSEELRFYSFLFFSIERKKNTMEVLDFIEKKQKILTSSFVMLRKKIIKYYSFFLRKTLRKQKLRSFYKYIPRLKKSIPKSTMLTYFLVNRRYKKMRRLRIFRLKRVHWAVPTYMQVDFRTLRAVLLYPPFPNEIHHSFKCSLTKISSFYKSLAL